jgi:hypothetical protein
MLVAQMVELSHISSNFFLFIPQPRPKKWQGGAAFLPTPLLPRQP